MALIKNNYNITIGDKHIIKVMEGDIQVWPEPTPPGPPPFPTMCIPASRPTAGPVKYASSIVPYGDYVLKRGEMYCKNGDGLITFSTGTTDICIVTAVPMTDIPSMADGKLYYRTGTGTTEYQGCAYVLRNKETGKYLALGIRSSVWIDTATPEMTHVFYDCMDASVDLDGYMIASRTIGQIDSNNMRMNISNGIMLTMTPQRYNGGYPYNYSSYDGWEADKVDIISSQFI